jgi:anti-sigma B factor antagonist
VEFEISRFNAVDNIVVLNVVGELDIATAPEFRRRLNELIHEGVRRVVVDISAVTFVDSTALSVFVGVVKQLAQLGGALAIACAEPKILVIFEITHLDTVLHICGSTDEAITLLQDLGEGATTPAGSI